MTILVIAEHDNASLKGATHHVVTAAAAIGGDVHVLVAGSNAGAAAQAAAKISGVAKVLHADGAQFAALEAVLHFAAHLSLEAGVVAFDEWGELGEMEA